MIPALVLTAGLATRLRPLSFVRAKAAMPVGGEPIVRRILRQLRASGIQEAVLNLHHLPHTITRVVGDGSDLDMRIRYSWEQPVLGSAGGPRQALPLLDAGTFVIVNGDTLTDVDITALLAEHKQSGALVTMTVVPPEPGAQYGGVRVESDGAVTGFTKRGSSCIRPSLPHTAAQCGRSRVGRNSSISARRLITFARRCFCLHERTEQPRSDHDGESTRAHTSKNRFCGTMWKWERARCCASASSRTAYAYLRVLHGLAPR